MFEAYKSNDDDIPADVLIFYSGKESDNEAYGFIRDIREVYNEELESVVKEISISTTTMGERVFYTTDDFTDDDVVIIRDGTEIDRDPEGGVKCQVGRGDVVQLDLTAEERVLKIHVRYDASEREWLAPTNPHGSIFNEHFYFGTIYRKSPGFLQITKGVTAFEVGNDMLSPIPCASNIKYLKCSDNGRNITEITMANIVDFQSNPGSASEAVVMTRAGNGVLVIVYE